MTATEGRTATGKCQHPLVEARMSHAISIGMPIEIAQQYLDHASMARTVNTEGKRRMRAVKKFWEGTAGRSSSCQRRGETLLRIRETPHPSRPPVSSIPRSVHAVMPTAETRESTWCDRREHVPPTDRNPPPVATLLHLVRNRPRTFARRLVGLHRGSRRTREEASLRQHVCRARLISELRKDGYRRALRPGRRSGL